MLKKYGFRSFGRLAADLTGFGMISHSGVWEYLMLNNKTMSNVEVEEAVDIKWMVVNIFSFDGCMMPMVLRPSLL